MNVCLQPKTLCGKIVAPPSKSYAHRMLIAAFLSGQKTEIKNVGTSKDVSATVAALSALGGAFEKSGGDAVFLKRKEVCGEANVYCGESGSTLRFLLPVAAAMGVKATFTGEAGLLKRPVNGLIAPLNEHGAQIEGLKINGKIKSGRYVVDGSVSSQYITGLLFALPLLKGDSEIIIENGLSSAGYIDITLDVLGKFGVFVEKTERGFAVKGGQKYVSPGTVVVEGDFSGAAFPLSAGAIGGDVEVVGLNPSSRQGDAKIVELLQKFGANVTIAADSVRVKKGELNGFEIDIDSIPDLAQILAVVAAFSKGKTLLKNVSRLKIKESDRIKAIIDTLKVASVKTELKGDDLVIYGDNRPIGGLFNGNNDHRTVMSSAILAFFARGNSEIIGAEAAEKSYPVFFDDMRALGGDTNVKV